LLVRVLSKKVYRERLEEVLLDTILFVSLTKPLEVDIKGYFSEPFDYRSRQAEVKHLLKQD